MDSNTCAHCGKPLRDDTVWYRPFAQIFPDDDPRSGTYGGVATTIPHSGQELPFHPECFEKRTGKKFNPPK